MRQAAIYVKDTRAGILTEDEFGYSFEYAPEYLGNPAAEPVSLTMPLRAEPYREKVLFPFFDGLIPEGWLLDIAEKSWKIDHRDRMSLLMVCCRDCIGSVSVIPIEEGGENE